MAIRFGNGFGIGASNSSGVSPFWVESIAGYTEVTGGVNASDDGYIVDPIVLPYDFYQDGNNSNELYVGTNGIVSLGSGYDNCCPNSPQDNSNLFAGNPGDMFMNPGDSMTDGSTMGAWYKITDYDGGVFKVEIKVFNIVLDEPTLISSYQVNLYRDVDYQYMESWAKIRPSDYNAPTKMGPYNDSDVSVPTSKTRNVWRSDLNGQNWTSLGNVSVPFNQVAVTPTPTPSNVAPLSQYTPNGTDGGNGLITYLNRDTGINASNQLPDQSGFNNDYSYSGGNPYTAGEGYVLGGGKYVYSSSNTQYNAIVNSMTIEMWVKIPSIPSTMSLVAAGANSGSGGWALRVDGSGNQLNLVKYNIADQTINLPSTLQANTWHHIVVAQGGSSLTYFVDGEIVGALNDAATNGFSYTSGNVNVSKDFYTSTNAGLTMGMLKIYDYCRLTADVVSEFNSHKSDYGFTVTPTPTPTPSATMDVTPTPTVTPSAVLHPYQYQLISDTNVTGAFGSNLTLACQGVDCHLNMTCSAQSYAPFVYFNNQTPSVGDNIYSDNNSNTTVSVTDGFYMLNDGYDGYTVVEIVSNQIASIPNCGTPTPTPSVTNTTTPTPTTSLSASAPMVVTISESGSNVVMTSTGTINLSGLTLVTSSFGPVGQGGLGISSATFITGPNGGYGSTYSGFTSVPSNFGSGSGGANNSGSGDVFGVIFDMAPPYLLVVPTGYTSGANISSTQTFTGQTLSSLGLTNGTYTYTWSGGSIDVVVGGAAPTPTPTPSTGAVGAGWNFYETSGTIITNPPQSDGQILMYTNAGGPPTSTYNPNNGAAQYILFYKKNSAGTDYTTQFTNLQTNGGTINVTQNGNTATYVGGSGVFNFDAGGFLVIPTAIQTVTVANPFTYGDTITLSFS